MAESNDSNRRTLPGTAGTAQNLVVDGLPSCTILRLMTGHGTR
jgi:hypothetical protein